jgi:hypothetical protein
MKPFGEWLHSDPRKHEPAVIERPAESAEKKKLQDELAVLRDMVVNNDPNLCWNQLLGYTYRCQVCERWRDLEDIADYNPDFRYCGGSPSCCP